ncbi:GNAT family N-acetyltransferase [Microbacterium sp. MYb62]|uniref:GNAT family N-acetyltransferase n=1 Tax=Microbacterium sp. MYb62 TaxID=1848690 RepID=UPI000CFE1DA1|nr:GNAT family N-acetyltransferase [Microbacterium sp. MYb62]PRB12235.1 GNAT family N-acetyltransferase [Microbacterium sp. MYb62]
MHQQYLEAYDRQLRATPEIAGASSTVELGPLLLATFAGGRGFITYAELGEMDAEGVARLVDAAIDHFVDLPTVTSVEWKTRGHDHAPGLHDALVARGFRPEDPESIMVGEAGLLAQEVGIPVEVTIRRARGDEEVLAAGEMQGRVFEDPDWRSRAEALIARLHEDSSTELWIAVVDDEVVGAGRLEPVAGTEFAGLWGGAILPEWRGRGVYRALTAERARSALALGIRFLQSDSTEFSRPILERSGFLKVSTTTPYVWTRPSV